MKLFLKSYKTTIAGLALAALHLYANGAGPKQIALAVAFAILGLLAKDADAGPAVVLPPVPPAGAGAMDPRAGAKP